MKPLKKTLRKKSSKRKSSRRRGGAASWSGPSWPHRENEPGGFIEGEFEKKQLAILQRGHAMLAKIEANAAVNVAETHKSIQRIEHDHSRSTPTYKMQMKKMHILFGVPADPYGGLRGEAITIKNMIATGFEDEALFIEKIKVFLQCLSKDELSGLRIFMIPLQGDTEQSRSGRIVQEILHILGFRSTRDCSFFNGVTLI